MQMTVVLTVAESKRLIAKGVARLDYVREALEHGIVAIAKGTTDAYIVEEILGKRIDKPDYCTGTTFPAKREGGRTTSGKIADVVLEKGKALNVTVKEAIAQMKEGDVFMKGANALNYERRQAGVLIGHPTGGTVGATLGTTVARRIHWLTPIGLEKSIPIDIVEAARRAAAATPRRGNVPALWPVGGDIFTEIEALRTLACVDAFPIGAGGIGGAEGSVRLAIEGAPDQIDAAARLLGDIQGEPPFIE